MVSRKLCHVDTLPIAQTYFQSICIRDFELLFDLKKLQTWQQRKVGGRRVKMQGSLHLSGDLEWEVQTPAPVNLLWPCHQFLGTGWKQEGTIYSTFTWASYPTPANTCRRRLPQDPLPLGVVTEPHPQGRRPRWTIPRNSGQIIGTPFMCLGH